LRLTDKGRRIRSVGPHVRLQEPPEGLGRLDIVEIQVDNDVSIVIHRPLDTMSPNTCLSPRFPEPSKRFRPRVEVGYRMLYVQRRHRFLLL
jgi:hypothetical protein